MTTTMDKDDDDDDGLHAWFRLVANRLHNSNLNVYFRSRQKMATAYAVTTLQPGQPGQLVQLAQPQTLVIASQPPAAAASGPKTPRQNERDWSTGLFACLGDCSCKFPEFYNCPRIRTILENKLLSCSIVQS